MIHRFDTMGFIAAAVIAASLTLAGCNNSPPQPPSQPTPPNAGKPRGAAIDGSEDRRGSSDEKPPEQQVATERSKTPAVSKPATAPTAPQPSTEKPVAAPPIPPPPAGGVAWPPVDAPGGEPAEDKPLGVPDRDRPGFLSITFNDVTRFKWEFIGIADTLGGEKRDKVTDKTREQIPARLRELNGKPVSITGFMMPIQVKPGGECTSFMLVRDRVFCCFGAPLGLTDWVMVEMEKGKSTTAVQDVPTVVFGTIDITPEASDGVILSLLHIKASDVSKMRPN